MAADWWADTLAIPRDAFRKPTIKSHDPKTVRHNVGDDYHGCLTIAAPKSRKFY